MTRQQLEEKALASERWQWLAMRGGAMETGVVAITLGMMMWDVMPLLNALLRHSKDKILLLAWVEKFFVFLDGFAALGMFLPLIFYAVALKLNRVLCPECGRKILPGHVLRSGHCSNCGARLLADEEMTPPNLTMRNMRRAIGYFVIFALIIALWFFSLEDLVWDESGLSAYGRSMGILLLTAGGLSWVIVPFLKLWEKNSTRKTQKLSEPGENYSPVDPEQIRHYLRISSWVNISVCGLVVGLSVSGGLLVMIPGLILIFFVSVMGENLWIRNPERRKLLDQCPRCHFYGTYHIGHFQMRCMDDFFWQKVLKTGVCPHCGYEFWPKPPDGIKAHAETPVTR